MKADTSELHLQDLFDLMPQLGWTARPDGWIDFYNRGWYDFTGTRLEEMQGYGWEKVQHPDWVVSVRELWRSSISKGEPFEMQFPLRRHDGIYRWFLTRIRPMLDANGALIRWVGINTDIQEQKDEAERLKLVAESIPQIVWISEPNGERYYFNKRWTEVTGLTQEESSGLGWCAALSDDDRESILKQWATARELEQEIEVEYRLKTLQGLKWYFTRAIPVRDSNGKVSTWFGSCTDVHDQKVRTNELEHLVGERTVELERALEEVQIASKLKAQFVAMVTHEVRTPMAGVIGLAELLTMKSSLDTDSKMLAEELFASSKRLLVMLNDILDFSKADSGQLILEQQSFSLPSVVNECADSLRFVAQKKQIRFKETFDSKLPPLVRGDELRVRQVLLNLLSNAVKFTPASGIVEVKVDLTSETTDSIKLKVSVVDTGIGISLEAQRNLFQPFKQADVSISRRFGGTGLGLSICKRYVELMGGEIGVESVPGEGATFWFALSVGKSELS